MNKFLPIILVFSLLAFIQGCVASHKTVKTQDERISNLEMENQRLKSQVETMDNQIFVLQDVMVALQQEAEIRENERKAIEAKTRKKRSSKTGSKADKGVASFQKAFDTYQDGNYGEAIIQFSRFLKSYPDSKFSQKAQYLLGECYFNQKEYLLAIQEYYKVPVDYPGGRMIKKAILRSGESYLQMNEPEMAEATFRQLTVMYPLSNEALYAQQKLFVLEGSIQ